MAKAFLTSYEGQTTEELLALASTYRVDSLVLAFEQAIERKSPEAISREESYVLAVEALEREVNNGGFGQFFANSDGAFTSTIEAALRAIGCPKTADISRDAIAALGIGNPTAEALAAVALADDARVQAALAACDERFFAGEEPIADRLFQWIAAHRNSIRVGDV